jgi:hypothetical protein
MPGLLEAPALFMPSDSEFPRIEFRDCLKNSLTRPLERQSTVTHPENRVNKARFSYSGRPLGLPLEIFQTVSSGSPVSEKNSSWQSGE